MDLALFPCGGALLCRLGAASRQSKHQSRDARYGMNLIISAPSCRAGRSCAEFRNLAVAAERHHCECVHASIRHFHSRRTARHTGHGDSANVAWLVLEESRDMRSEEHTSELQSLMRTSH